jgi:hypothetical protein
MEREIDEDTGVRGGQGRSAREIHESSLLWAVVILVAAAAMVVLMGCSHLNRVGPF